MERWWTLEEANAALGRVTELLEQARAAAQAVIEAGVETSSEGNGHVSAAPERHDLDEALRALTDDGIVVRDLERGLIDFPATAPSGRTYLLCWLLGEPEVAWWHWPEDGFAGRTPLDRPPE
jgi:hypothetical protein